jgi:hypothetical protein
VVEIPPPAPEEPAAQETSAPEDPVAEAPAEAPAEEEAVPGVAEARQLFTEVQNYLLTFRVELVTSSMLTSAALVDIIHRLRSFRSALVGVWQSYRAQVEVAQEEYLYIKQRHTEDFEQVLHVKGSVKGTNKEQREAKTEAYLASEGMTTRAAVEKAHRAYDQARAAVAMVEFQIKDLDAARSDVVGQITCLKYEHGDLQRGVQA